MAEDNSDTDLEWIIYHLTMNDDDGFTSVPLDVDLCRTEDDQWTRLVIGLARNQTLKSLELTRGMQQMIASEADLEELFAAVRSIPRLSKIRLDSFSTHDLRHAWGLFWNNETLEDIVVENVRVAANTVHTNRFDDTHTAFLISMTQRSLKRLRIEVPKELSASSPVHAPFAPLLVPSSKLEELVIESSATVYPINEDHFAALMETLQTNITLRYLDIDLRMSPECVDRVSTMLERNKHVRDLRLHLHPRTKERPEILLRFLRALKTTNKTLTKFVNYGLFGLTSPNHHLIEMELDMLNSNLFLESFSLLNEDAAIRQQREFFLRLNQNGRKLVQHGEREMVPRSVWVDRLVKHSEDLSGLFYYISTNPLLCHLDGTFSDAHAVAMSAVADKGHQEATDDNPRAVKRLKRVIT
jgi:hypothetical protein